MIVIAPSLSHLLKRSPDPSKDHHIHQGDGDQEQRRNRRANSGPDLFQKIELILDDRRDGINDQRRDHDNRGMAKRKEKTHRDRLFALLHQLSGHVVDRRNVIRIDGMPKAEGVSEKSGSK